MPCPNIAGSAMRQKVGEAKLKDGDESAAQRLAQTALQELQDANDAMK